MEEYFKMEDDPEIDKHFSKLKRKQKKFYNKISNDRRSSKQIYYKLLTFSNKIENVNSNQESPIMGSPKRMSL